MNCNYIITSDNTTNAISIYGAGSTDSGQLGIGVTTDTSKNVLTQMVNNTGRIPRSISHNYSATGVGHHAVVLMTDGTIYATGNNYIGQLGIGTTDSSKNTLTLTSLGTTAKVKSVICGSKFTMALMTDGSLYATGDNNEGSFGKSSPISSTSFIKITTAPLDTKTPKEIVCGNGFTIMLMTDGTLYGTGFNNVGQYGTGIFYSYNNFTQITALDGKTPKSIQCGRDFTVVLMTDNTIYATGGNTYGQLGIANNINVNVLTKMYGLNTINKTPKSISCGDRTTLVLMTDGTLYGTGSLTGMGINTSSNSLLQITGLNSKIPKSISCIQESTTVVMTDGTVYVTGANSNGQLGVGNSFNQTSFVSLISFPLNNSVVSLSNTTSTYIIDTPPTINSVTYNSNGLNVNITPSDGYPIPTYNYSLNNGSTYTATTQIKSPIIIPNISPGAQLSISLVATNYAGDTAPSNIFNFTVPFPCFLEGSKILKFNQDTQTEQYVKIETLRKGDLIKTSRSGYKAVSYIGKAQLSDPATNPDIRERLYTFSSKWAIKSEEDLGPLCITGRHNLLHTNLSDSEKEILTLQTGDVYITENKYRVPAYLDARREPYTDNSPVTIWHFALEHPDIEQNYGVYANGILVESSSAEYMTEHSNMELLD